MGFKQLFNLRQKGLKSSMPFCHTICHLVICHFVMFIIYELFVMLRTISLQTLLFYTYYYVI